MTTISTKSSLITLINVFTVEPANQRRLIELLTEATDVSVRRAPGFVSASLHRSTDGTKVTMYAQWRSIDEYQAMRQHPAPLPFFQEALKITSLNPASTRSWKPSHPSANRTEATTVLSTLRHTGTFRLRMRLNPRDQNTKSQSSAAISSHVGRLICFEAITISNSPFLNL